MATRQKKGKIATKTTKVVKASKFGFPRPISLKKALAFKAKSKHQTKLKTKADRIKAITQVSMVTHFHKVHLVPLVVQKLKKATSKNRFVSASEIVNSLYKHHGIKINSGLLRSILHYIRINGIVKCVLATGQGYFITNDTLEMQTYLKSLNKRIRQIGALRKALDAQGHEVLGKQLKTKLNPRKTKK